MTLPGDAPDLRLGDSSEWVTDLQRLLHALDHLRRDPDGTFDEETQRAVEEFQSTAGLPADGMVGRETWTALFAAAPPEQYGAVEPAFGDQPAAGQPSEDGQWIWDGDRWVGAGDGRPERSAEADPTGPPDGDGQLSADRQWRWDGVEWQPAHQ
jgi:peptidoglycan hydrolase-like protein with peptidoglycan-binding domain